MIKKRQVLVMVSIAVMSFLIGTMFSTNFMALGSNEYGIPFAKIWEAIDDLQARVTSLEESVDTKTWHLVTSFTLSSEERVSQLFFIQGEKWRLHACMKETEEGITMRFLP